MIVRRGTKLDLEKVFDLESKALGEEVCWLPSRTSKWIDMGAYDAVIVEEGGEILSFACAFQISREAYDGIVSGKLLPESLDHIVHGSSNSGCHWIGLVLTIPSRRGEGLAKLSYDELSKVIGQHLVADAYSEGGESMANYYSWVKVVNGERPVYINNVSSC